MVVDYAGIIRTIRDCRLPLDKDTNFEVLKHLECRRRVLVPKFVGHDILEVAASVLEEESLTSRVVVEEGGDVVDIVLTGNPASLTRGPCSGVSTGDASRCTDGCKGRRLAG